MDLIYQVKFKLMKREFLFEGTDCFGFAKKLANNNYYLYNRFLSNMFPARNINWVLQKKESEK